MWYQIVMMIIETQLRSGITVSASTVYVNNGGICQHRRNQDVAVHTMHAANISSCGLATIPCLRIVVSYEEAKFQRTNKPRQEDHG
jgi:hypothetical protein